MHRLSPPRLRSFPHPFWERKDTGCSFSGESEGDWVWWDCALRCYFCLCFWDGYRFVLVRYRDARVPRLRAALAVESTFDVFAHTVCAASGIFTAEGSILSLTYLVLALLISCTVGITEQYPRTVFLRCLARRCYGSDKCILRRCGTPPQLVSRRLDSGSRAARRPLFEPYFHRTRARTRTLSSSDPGEILDRSDSSCYCRMMRRVVVGRSSRRACVELGEEDARGDDTTADINSYFAASHSSRRSGCW
ncbi:hypothetical protein C8R44DRAFT_332119 [Mycena epipterygia]|nr:hypothetical protein C8R44DRAFT_332119 [Mycena epipterygia]